ncbi:TPA: PQ loop repeat-containing protein 2 [Trebouxia sp. C0004]
MACLFAILDILLNVQHCWYVYWVVPRRAKQEQEQQTATAVAEPHDPAARLLTQQPPVDLLLKPVTDAPPVNTGMHVTPDAASSKDIELMSVPTAKIPAAHQLRALSAGLMLVGCGMMTTGIPTMITAGVTGTLPGASDYKSTSGAWAQHHLSVGRVLLNDSGATAASGRTVNIGQGLGWVMTVTYLAARVPQLFKNFRRGTTQGLSLFMFVLLVLGSITYVLSIFIRSTAAEFVVPKLPWIIEALGAMLLDGSIVFQIFYYRRKNRNKPPPQVPASVNPLGTIAL